MKKIFAAVLFSAALVITGCGTDAEPTPTKTVFVEKQQETDSSGFSDTEQEFLFDVAQFMTPALNDEPQADVVDLGYSICTALEQGVPISRIIETAVGGGVTRTDTEVIVAAATVNLCPGQSLDSSSST